jgi:hypothetical protein
MTSKQEEQFKRAEGVLQSLANRLHQEDIALVSVLICFDDEHITYSRVIKCNEEELECAIDILEQTDPDENVIDVDAEPIPVH